MDFATQDMLLHDERTGKMTHAELDAAYDHASRHHKVVFHRWLDEGGIEEMAEDYERVEVDAG